MLYRVVKLKTNPMKLILFSTVTLLTFLISGSAFAQSTKPVTVPKTATAEKTVHAYSYKVDSAKLATKNSSTSSVSQKDINYYDNFIEALEIKKEYVLNNPEEKAKAEESGWLKKIDKELAKAKAERELLLQK